MAPLYTGKKILIIGPSWLGDMVMAHSLIQVLVSNGASDITVMAPSWCLAVTEHMPEITHRIVLPIQHGELALRRRYQIAKEIQPHCYDVAIVLPNSFKSGLIPFLARIPTRIGWLGESRWGLLNDVRKLIKKDFPLMISRFAQLGVPSEQLPIDAPWPRLTVNDTEVKKTQSDFGWQDKPTLALCPGAEYGPSKRWPVSHFISLAQRYLEKNWQVVLLGSPKEMDLAESIQSACENRCLNLIGITNINQAVNILSAVDVAVCNDSGLMHVASALGKKVIAIYGSTPPQLAPPLSKTANIMYQNLACSPCFKRECPLEHYNCLELTLPADIQNIISEWNP